MNALPLSNLKVLDLTRVLAGPWCTQLFGDLGADVIKVEQPKIGDSTRSWGPPFLDGESGYFLSTNRNKRSTSLNFNDINDLKTIQELAKTADVIIENYKHNGLNKFNLDYSSIKEGNPKVIYCSIHGFSPQSSLAKTPGYDAVIQAMSGLMSITGPDSGDPIKVGVAVSDILTGLYASNAVLAALYERERSNQGQKIDLALMDVQVASLANVMMSYLITKSTPTPKGTAHPTIVPYQCFETSDGLIMLAVGNDQQFKNLSLCLDSQWHTDNKFSTNPQRVTHREELIPQISNKLAKQNKDHWLKLFQKNAIPSGPVNNLEELTSSPYAKEANLFPTFENSNTQTPKNPIEFSRTPIKTYKTPPKLSSPNAPPIHWKHPPKKTEA